MFMVLKNSQAMPAIYLVTKKTEVSSMISMNTAKQVGIGVGLAVVAIAGTLFGPKAFKGVKSSYKGRKDRKAKVAKEAAKDSKDSQ